MGGTGRNIRRGSSFPDNSIICRMMLQFRPIAPKPVHGQAAATDMPPEKTNGSNGRVKRKYARIRRNKQYYCKKKKNTKSTSSSVEPSIINKQQGSTNKSLVTLELLPKRSDDEDLIKNKEIWCNFGNHRIPSLELLMQGKDNEDNRTNHDDQKKVVVQRSIVMETWVIVEKVVSTSVRNTCMDDGIGLGFSDVDKMNNLRLDPSPGFVSEFSGKVHWVNDAYKKLVISGGDGVEEELPAELVVRLVTKQELPCACPLFGCTVRFEYALGGRKCSRIVPSDVWRMDFGGFAWKLDIKASLSLGLQH